MMPPTLLAVPNVSEGRDRRVIEAIGEAFADAATEPGTADAGAVGGGPTTSNRRPGVRLLDVHCDRDHDRSVFTLAGAAGELADAVLSGAASAVERIDVMSRRPSDRSGASTPSEELGRGDEPVGQHPYVGAIDVAPVVYLEESERGAACAEALVIADRIGSELGVPVFLYGELTGTDVPVTRAELRRGGVAGLASRMALAEESAGGCQPDFGPPRLHPTAGAALVAARGPLVAFNLRLRPPASIKDARAIAALIREGGADGLPGVRAIGVALSGGAVQVSMNVERPLEVPLARVVEAVARHAGVASAELVGLAPRAAFDAFPADVALPGFDPARQLIENALRS
jgi:glutamate formiminotransferase / 5-formyltetrahydrofolate cyclo-ligase